MAYQLPPTNETFLRHNINTGQGHLQYPQRRPQSREHRSLLANEASLRHDIHADQQPAPNQSWIWSFEQRQYYRQEHRNGQWVTTCAEQRDTIQPLHQPILNKAFRGQDEHAVPYLSGQRAQNEPFLRHWDHIYTDLQDPQLAIANTAFLRHDIYAEQQPLQQVYLRSSYAPSSSNHSIDQCRSTTFRYPPLEDNAERPLRLLQIERIREGNKDIHCRLVCTKAIQTTRHYECLSYCWGGVDRTREIMIRTEKSDQYQSFLVTPNLEGALIRLRDTNCSTWLWIDAICINQDDLIERAAQVGFMKDIYNDSIGVIVWLGGEKSSTLSSAVYVIASISKQFASDTLLRPESIIGPEGVLLSDQEFELLKKYTTDKVLGMPAMEAYKCIASFFSLPWFRRVWVLQEASSHRTVIVRLGAHSFPWGSVVLAALWGQFQTRVYTAIQNPSLQSDIDRQGYLPELWLGLLHRRTPRGLSMTELVFRAREFQASDPRDKVFALLGLANDLSHEQRSFFVDYTKTKERVYCDFARALIDITGNLDILSAVNTFSEYKDRGCVSWMPGLDVSISAIRGLGFPRKYNAALIKPSPTSFFSRPVRPFWPKNQTLRALHNNPWETTIDPGKYDPNVLSLLGYVVDTVHETTNTTFRMRQDLRICLDNDSDAIHIVWKFIQTPHIYQRYTKSQLLIAFLHTLTAAGFTLLGEFSSYTLGKVVPSYQVPSLFADFAAYWARSDPSFSRLIKSSPTSLAESTEIIELARSGDADQFAVVAGKACHERKFFLSKSGRVGLCPRGARNGDRVVILYGGSVPYVLRQLENEAWTFVGECYVDGLMFGEAEEIRKTNEILEVVFNIC